MEQLLDRIDHWLRKEPRTLNDIIRKINQTQEQTTHIPSDKVLTTDKRDQMRLTTELRRLGADGADSREKKV